MNNLQEKQSENKPEATTPATQLKLIDDILRHFDYEITRLPLGEKRIQISREVEVMQSIRSLVSALANAEKFGDAEFEAYNEFAPSALSGLTLCHVNRFGKKYAASFLPAFDLQEAEKRFYPDLWCDHADELPASATGATIAEAVELALMLAHTKGESE